MAQEPAPSGELCAIFIIDYRMRIRSSIICSVPFVAMLCSFLNCTTSKTTKSANSNATITGTWRLVEYKERDSTGKKVSTYGEHPVGYFIYTANGYLSINVMRNPPPPSLDFPNASAQQLRDRLVAGFSYFGRYKIIDDSTIVHIVEGGTVMSYIGTEQIRRYKLKEDSLWIGVPGNQCCTLTRTK